MMMRMYMKKQKADLGWSKKLSFFTFGFTCLPLNLFTFWDDWHSCMSAKEIATDTPQIWLQYTYIITIKMSKKKKKCTSMGGKRYTIFWRHFHQEHEQLLGPFCGSSVLTPLKHQFELLLCSVQQKASAFSFIYYYLLFLFLFFQLVENELSSLQIMGLANIRGRLMSDLIQKRRTLAETPTSPAKLRQHSLARNRDTCAQNEINRKNSF